MDNILHWGGLAVVGGYIVTSLLILSGVPGAESIGQQHGLEDAHGAPLASPSLLPLLPLLLPVSSVSVASSADPTVGCCTPVVLGDSGHLVTHLLGWLGTPLLINCAALGGGNLTTDSSGLALGTTAILAATVCRRAEDSHAHGAQQKA